MRSMIIYMHFLCLYYKFKYTIYIFIVALHANKKTRIVYKKAKVNKELFENDPILEK